MLARQAWLNGQPDVAVYALRQIWEIGRYSVAFDAELLWQLASMLAKAGNGRSTEDIQNWLRHLDKAAQQEVRLRPLAALLRLILAQGKELQPDAAALQDVCAELLARQDGYTAVTLLQLGDWLQQLDALPAARQLWQRCGDRHSTIAGVPEQLERRLSDFAGNAMRQAASQSREAIALQLTGESAQAAQLFAGVLEQAPALLETNMAAARLHAALAGAGDSASAPLVAACLQRIGQMSPLEPDALDFSRMNNPLEARPW